MDRPAARRDHLAARFILPMLLGLLLAEPLRGAQPPEDGLDDADVEDVGKADAEDAEAIDSLTLDFLRGAEIEDLINIEVARVTTIAGVPRELIEAPSAITVLRRGDVQRTGHRSIAEALRLVPGMYVGRMASYNWRVGARGFSGAFAPRNLVLIDGRTVYDPLFSGTFWDVQDIVFEDLDRIEVIRGPGATLWGANAMNGVINVVTRSAHETQGLYLSGGGGTYEQGFGTVRYGGRIDEDTAYRVYAKYFNRAAFESPGPEDAHDDWSMLRGGFRVDRHIDPDTTMTVLGSAHNSLTLGEAVNIPDPNAHLQNLVEVGDRRASGGHVLARIEHSDPLARGWSVQALYDRTDRVLNAGFEARRDTFDIDVRQHFPWGDGDLHQFIWGIGYRYTADRTEDGPNIRFSPRSRDFQTVEAFAQNTFELVPDEWYFMLGSKFEWNSFTDFEIQPGARLWWTPDDRQTIWGAISRPVRIPSRTEKDATLTLAYVDTGLLAGDPPTGMFVPLEGAPGGNLEAEKLLAYELGYRKRLTDELTVDLTLFYHDYDDLISVPPLFGQWNNDGRGESYGVEVAADWAVAENWRLAGGYSFLRVHVHGPVFPFDEGEVPQHQAFLRSHLDLTKEWLLDTVFYYYDHLPGLDISSYGRLDVGLTWRPTEHFEVSLWGQNLLDRSTPEASLAREFERSFYIQGTLRY